MQGPLILGVLTFVLGLVSFIVSMCLLVWILMGGIPAIPAGVISVVGFFAMVYGFIRVAKVSNRQSVLDWDAKWKKEYTEEFGKDNN